MNTEQPKTPVEIARGPHIWWRAATIGDVYAALLNGTVMLSDRYRTAPDQPWQTLSDNPEACRYAASAAGCRKTPERGAALSAVSSQQAKSIPTKYLVLLLAILLISILPVALFVSDWTAGSESPTSSRSFSSHLSAWDGSHRGVVRWVKSRMHDPDSFDHVDTQYKKAPDIPGQHLVFMDFRGKNGFGATIGSRARVLVSGDRVIYGRISPH